MAKAVTLKNNDNEDIYPVTSIDLVNGEVPTSKLANGAITTAKITNLAVTGAKLADGSITGDKIDYSSMGPVWSGFYISGAPVENQDIVFTTKKGTQLTLRIGNGATAMRIVSGGDNINIVRQYWGCQLSSVGSEFGVHGLASGSNCYCRYYGAIMASSVAGPGENTQVASTGTDGECYSSLAATGSNARNGTVCELTAIRQAPSGSYKNRWSICGKIACIGVRLSMSFEAQCSSADGYIPTIYQRGATTANTPSIYNYIEVLEV